MDQNKTTNNSLTFKKNKIRQLRQLIYTLTTLTSLLTLYDILNFTPEDLFLTKDIYFTGYGRVKHSIQWKLNNYPDIHTFLINLTLVYTLRFIAQQLIYYIPELERLAERELAEREQAETKRQTQSQSSKIIQLNRGGGSRVSDILTWLIDHLPSWVPETLVKVTGGIVSVPYKKIDATYSAISSGNKIGSGNKISGNNNKITSSLAVSVNAVAKQNPAYIMVEVALVQGVVIMMRHVEQEAREEGFWNTVENVLRESIPNLSHQTKKTIRNFGCKAPFSELIEMYLSKKGIYSDTFHRQRLFLSLLSQRMRGKTEIPEITDIFIKCIAFLDHKLFYQNQWEVYKHLYDDLRIAFINGEITFNQLARLQQLLKDENSLIPPELFELIEQNRVSGIASPGFPHLRGGGSSQIILENSPTLETKFRKKIRKKLRKKINNLTSKSSQIVSNLIGLAVLIALLTLTDPDPVTGTAKNNNFSHLASSVSSIERVESQSQSQSLKSDVLGLESNLDESQSNKMFEKESNTPRKSKSRKSRSIKSKGRTQVFRTNMFSEVGEFEEAEILETNLKQKSQKLRIKNKNSK